jgi:nicotinamide mononucleotide transporter
MLDYILGSSDFVREAVEWLTAKYIEVLATAFGLLYIYFSVKGKIILWLFGLLTSGLYVYVFFRSEIFADMGINVYYVMVSIYGWYHWKYEKKKGQKQLPYSRLNLKNGILLFIISLIILLFIALILNTWTSSTIAWWDAFTTAFSITATWMLARKIIEQWLIWIVVDLVSIGLYIYKGLHPTALLFAVYTVLAFMGYRAWLKEWNTQENKI